MINNFKNTGLNADIGSSITASNEPIPLPDSLPEVMKFEPEMLPESIRGYVLDVADRQQCPPDFVAVAAIVGLAAVLGRKVLMQPKQNDDSWRVFPNQWGALIGRPSTMKSPSMKEALKSLHKIEDSAEDDYVSAKKRYEAQLVFDELNKDEATKKAKKLYINGSKDDALNLLENVLDISPPPTKQRIVVNDPSVEKLGVLLNLNPNGLVLVRDELSGWISKMMQDEFQGERAFYLECFDGGNRYTWDRIGRGTIEIKNCILSVIGGIQPSKIAKLVRSAIRGITDDGLVQRLQLTVWPDDIGNWKWQDRKPDRIMQEQYEQVYNMLNNLPLPDDINDTPILKFSPEAQILFIKWMEELQAMARSVDTHPALESHLLKMPKTIAGLALIFELIELCRESLEYVSKISILRAMDFAKYLISHAKRLYSVAINPGVDGAKLILLRKDRLSHPFTTRDVQRKCWAGLDNLEAVNESIQCLIDHRYIYARETKSTDAGGRRTIEFFWLN